MQSIEYIKIGLQLASFLLTIGMGIAGVWAFKKITENHLAHIDLDLKKIIKTVDKNTNDINTLNISVANLKGRFGEKE
ncbi:MAG: hypothetical protein M0R03_12435 [Novosphingobium sp.]|nr:hypothetical protein [Novosphingobium sp.]